MCALLASVVIFLTNSEPPSTESTEVTQSRTRQNVKLGPVRSRRWSFGPRCCPDTSLGIYRGARQGLCDRSSLCSDRRLSSRARQAQLSNRDNDRAPLRNGAPLRPSSCS